MILRAVEQERELKEQRTSKACGKQSSCCSDRLYSEEEGNRNEGNEEDFSSDQASVAVTEGEEIEPKTVKDARCQTIEFDYRLTRYFKQADIKPRIKIFLTPTI